MQKVGSNMMIFRRRIELNVGWAEFDERDMVRVGNRRVGRIIEVEFPGTEGQPRLRMTIDSSSGIPRCTDVHISAVEDGREIRTTDLRAVEINNWVELIFSVASDEIVWEGEGGMTNSIVRIPDSESHDAKAARSTLRQARRSSPRKVTPELLRRVADVYLKDDVRPAEAVALAFNLADRTAFRYIALARAQGFLPDSKRTIKFKE